MIRAVVYMIINVVQIVVLVDHAIHHITAGSIAVGIVIVVADVVKTQSVPGGLVIAAIGIMTVVVDIVKMDIAQ